MIINLKERGAVTIFIDIFTGNYNPIFLIMSKSYLSERAARKKTAFKGVWFIIIIAVIFLAILLKYSMSGTVISYSAGMPGSTDAYNIAKNFIREATKSEVIFPESGFQFGKKSDSVYIIKSYFEETLEGGEKDKKNYKIVIRYNGGGFNKTTNWSLISLDSNR
jgi:hypothetical protein